MKRQGEIQGYYFTNAAIIILLLIVALLLTPAALAAHTFDTSATDGTTTFAASPNPRTLSYTAGTGSTLMVLNIFTATNTARAGGAPTFNGDPFTQVGTRQPTAGSTVEGAVEMWYLPLDASDTGSAYQVSVPNTGSLLMRIHVSTYKSTTGASALDIYAQRPNTGTTEANPSQSITTTVNGDVLVDALIDGNLNVPTANSHTLIYEQDGGSYSADSQYYLQAAAGAQALSWTVAADDFALITASFKEVAPPPSYTVSGRVTYLVNGSGVDNATITTNRSIFATTNSNGYYSFTSTNKSILITATKAGYKSPTTTITVSGADVTANTIQLEFEFDEVTIDATTSITPIDHRGQPALVFINDTIGYMFYKDLGTASIGYSKTTDGGETWGGRVATTAQTDIVGFNIWYDRWTPGDTTGTIIHIAMMDSSSDDVWYDTVDTSNDTQGTEVSIDATVIYGFTTVDKVTITKNTSGVLFIGVDDTTIAGKVKMCSTTCATASNWANVGTSPLETQNDFIRLVPIASGNIMLIEDNISANTIRSNIWDGSSWAGWVNIDTNGVASTTYTESISPTLNRFNNDIYLSYGTTLGANTAVIKTAMYNGTVWTSKTNVDASTGISDRLTKFDIFRDENTGDIYLAYLRGTLTTSMNAYYKKSTDGMVTWSTENKFNTVTGDLRWMYMNMMSTSRAYAVFFQNTAGNDGLFGNTIAAFPLNILSYSNNVTNDDSSYITVNQGAVINFNLTTDIKIDLNTTSIPSNVTALSSSSVGGTTYDATFSFPDYGTQYVQLAVRNITRAGYTTINWTVIVNDVTPPGQVTNLTNSTPPTNDAINLIWDALTDNPGGSGIKDYLIFIQNNSINWLTKPRDTIDASTSAGNYTDAYRYNARLAIPVSCNYSTCHPSLTTPKHYPFYLKYDANYLYMEAMVPDNDSGSGDDYLGIVLDPSKNGGKSPQSDDRYYEFWEDGTTIKTFQGNNTTGWENYTSLAVWSVKRYTTPDNPNISGNMFEIRIPLSEIGSPINDSTVRFAIKHECNEGTADSATWFSRASYLPDTANDTIPDTWTLLFTYRNNTVWDNINSSTTNSYEATGLLPSFRYYFSVLARDNVLNYGLQSASKTLVTSDAPGYDISGYITSAGLPVNNANINTGQYIVHSDANGFYTLNDLINGTYILTIDASGFMGNSTNVTVSGANRFNVNITLQDLTPPSVISNTNNFIVSNGSFLILNASITDAYSGVKNATVNVSPVNSTINEAILTFSGGYWINTTIIADRGETVGVMNLTITTYDNSSNVNMGVNMTVGIDDAAPMVTSNTNSLYVSNGSFLTLDASIMDAFSGVKNATVNVSSVNSTINEAILTLSGDYWSNKTIIADNGENTGFKNLMITTYDNAGNVNKSINMTVWINPRLEIIDWSNNITNTQNLNITIFIDDSIRFNVTANQNVTYNWFYNETDQLINDNNFLNQFPTTGSYYVYAIVSNSDSTVYKNWTINVVYKPDLVMTMENISFSYVPSEVENGEVKENENVTINVTIYNAGLGDASNINVSFYDGSPGTGNNIANTTITNISAGSSQNATIYWNSIIGTHNISIKVDPENTLVETDDSNNIASKNINVSAWQKYYGNVSGNLSLRDNNGNSMTNWYWATPQGNIFISNNSLIDYSNLQALGRKKNGNVSLNNFGRADEILKMIPGSMNSTGFFNNNITMLFSSNGTTPRNYTNFTVYGRKIENVAIFNSTNTANFNSVETSTFITGILWDTSKDDGDGEYGDDSEDIVFISGINVNKTGLGKSSHDYEIAVPSVIRSEGNVYFFVELK